MTKTLAFAFKKASELPEETQEYIGQAVLDRVNALAQLREKIAVGMRSIDKGHVGKLDVGAIMRKVRAKHARRK